MSRQARAVHVVAVVASLLGLAGNALAQPTAWSSQRYFNSVLGFSYSLRVLDVGVGGLVASFDAPPGVELGPGALTPDGSYYLVTTNLGLARFTTSPPAFDRLLGPAATATGLAIAPTGSLVHLTGTFGHAVLDWRTGAVQSVRCCVQPLVSFTPDGVRRVEVEHVGLAPGETVLTTYDTATGTVRWSRTFAGRGSAAVSPTHLALAIGAQVLVLDTATGADEGLIPHAVSSPHWRGDTLVAIRTIATALPSLARLSSYTLPALAETVLVEQSYLPGRVQPVALYLSADQRYAYWLQFVSLLGLSVSNTTYSVFDLDERRFVASGSLGYQFQASLSLEAAAQCVFSVPDNLTAPARGGVVEVPVVPTPNCRPWSAPDAMNPGPHVGAATIREQVDPNPEGQTQQLARAIGGTTVRLTQAAEVPAPPVLRATVDGTRVQLSWDPSPGAGITAFEIRGAQAGTAPAAVTTVASSHREWTSPPLGPGSYVVQVVAGNRLGVGPPSNDVRFSIGVTTLPDAPELLQAVVVDDEVTLSWAPAATGPAPSGYVVEAAPPGVAAFVTVARLLEPRLRVGRAPVGPWQMRVRAVTAGGAGPPSGPVVVAPTACTAPPGPPGTPWPLLTYPSFTLRWSAPLVGSVDEYVIEVGSVTGASDIGRVRVGDGQTSVTLPQANPNRRAFARIRARNACGEGAPSGEVVVVLP